MKIWKDKQGATAIEYGLIAALLAIAVIVTIGELAKEKPAKSDVPKQEVEQPIAP